MFLSCFIAFPDSNSRSELRETGVLERRLTAPLPTASKSLYVDTDMTCFCYSWITEPQVRIVFILCHFPNEILQTSPDRSWCFLTHVNIDLATLNHTPHLFKSAFHILLTSFLFNLLFGVRRSVSTLHKGQKYAKSWEAGLLGRLGCRKTGIVFCSCANILRNSAKIFPPKYNLSLLYMLREVSLRCFKSASGLDIFSRFN